MAWCKLRTLPFQSHFEIVRVVFCIEKESDKVKCRKTQVVFAHYSGYARLGAVPLRKHRVRRKISYRCGSLYHLYRLQVGYYQEGEKNLPHSVLLLFCGSFSCVPDQLNVNLTSRISQINSRIGTCSIAFVSFSSLMLPMHVCALLKYCKKQNTNFADHTYGCIKILSASRGGKRKRQLQSRWS